MIPHSEITEGWYWAFYSKFDKDDLMVVWACEYLDILRVWLSGSGHYMKIEDFTFIEPIEPPSTEDTAQ